MARAALALLVVAAAAPLGAQELAVAEIRGRVLVGEAPAAGATVVVHRVAPDGSGPLDSLTAGRDGGFRFTLPTLPDGTETIYFASSERAGVSYFGPFVGTVADLDSLYVIRTYDTEEAPAGGFPLQVKARYFLLEEKPDTGWTVTDLVHVVNTGQTTLIAATGGATFVYPVPAGASDLRVGGDQIAPNTATLVDGAMRVTSAIPPGERELMFQYTVPDPYLTVRLPGAIAEVELLVEEPAPPLEVTGLGAVAPVDMGNGVTYRRFASTNVQDLSLEVGRGKGEPLIPTRWLAVGLAFLLAVSALYAVLRPHPSVAGQPGAALASPAGATPFERRQRLLLEIARLDEARDRGQIADPDEWAARRRTLLERVRELG